MPELLSDERFKFFAIAAVALYFVCGVLILNRTYGKDIEKPTNDPYAAFLMKKELYAFSLLFWPLLWLTHLLHFKDKLKDEKDDGSP